MATLGDALNALLHHHPRLLVFDQRKAQGVGDGRHGDIVVRRAEAAARDDRLRAARQQVAQVGDDGGVVVGTDDDGIDAEAGPGQLRSQVGPVGVAQAPVEQLRTGEHDGRLGARSGGAARKRAAHGFSMSFALGSSGSGGSGRFSSSARALAKYSIPDARVRATAV